MVRRPFAPWRRRRSSRRRVGEKGQLILTLILGLGMALFLIHRMDASLRPQLVSLSETRLRSQLVLIGEEALEGAMAEQAMTAGDLFILHQDQAGGVGAITADTVRLNSLRASLVREIAKRVSGLDSHDLGVPLGSLLGFDLFSAIGPEIPVRVLSVASAGGSYRSEFSDAGINQTLYRVILDVTIRAKLLLPGGVVETTVTTPVSIAETLIVGQVPQTYFNVN